MKKHERNRFYILNADGTVAPEPDIKKWGKWQEENNARRVVKRENDVVPGFDVSTVFLGTDHNWFTTTEGENPILWETMIFTNDTKHELHCYQERCGGMDSKLALEMHERVKALLLSKVKA